MAVDQIIGLVLSLLVMLAGAVGSVLPALPGTPLILIAAVGHRLYFGAAGASNWVLIVMALLVLISFALDQLASLYGARKLGASRRGMIGAVIGGLVGMFFGLPGLILGPFLGAVIFELLGSYEFKKAARAGVGVILGLLAGAVGKFAICIVMICLFAVSVISRSHAAG